MSSRLFLILTYTMDHVRFNCFKGPVNVSYAMTSISNMCYVIIQPRLSTSVLHSTVKIPVPHATNPWTNCLFATAYATDTAAIITRTEKLPFNLSPTSQNINPTPIFYSSATLSNDFSYCSS